MKKFMDEFKEFAIKGNAVQMAVGVVIGAAFGAIVTSLVADIIMPLISLLTGSVNFKDLVLVIGQTAEGQPLLLTYGAFIQSAVDFLLTALSIFMMIRVLNKMTKPKPVAEVAPEKEAEDILLLKSILEELKKNN